MGDRYGRKGVLLIGLSIFGAASLASVFVTTSLPLISMRAVMGGAAALKRFPTSHRKWQGPLLPPVSAPNDASAREHSPHFGRRRSFVFNDSRRSNTT